MAGMPPPQGRIKLVADVAVFRDGRVLLVKYEDVRRYDGERGWFLPDDYLHRLEHPMDAGTRILREQVGIDGVDLDVGFIESFAGEGDWHLVFHLVGTLRDGGEASPAGNTAAAEWFPLAELPARSEMAHEGWAADVLDVLRRARTEAIQVRSVVE
jgi:ADP-ribose pyrophosphatase YjhB (NUDIX family)